MKPLLLILALVIGFVFAGCETRTSSSLGNPQDSADTAATSLSGNASKSENLRALQAYNQALSDDPTDLGALGNRARLYAQMGKVLEALADYDELLRSDPNNAPALERRAALLSQMGRYGDAIQDYDQLIRNPVSDLAPLYNDRGKVKLDHGLAKEAEADFDQVLASRPNWPEALSNRGAARFALGNYEAARQDYSHAIAMDVNFAEAYNGLGLIAQFVDEDLVVAEVSFGKARTLDRTNAGAWYNLAYLEASRKETSKAIADFNEAIRLDTTYVDARINRGILFMQTHNPDSALRDFDWVIARRPNEGRSWQLRGWANCELGHRAQGCIDFSAASNLGLRDNPDHEKLVERYCR